MTEIDTFERGIGVTTLAAQGGAMGNVEDNSPIAVNGVALPENTVLRGGQGVEHFYSPEAAEQAAENLQEQLDDENNTVHIVKNFHDIEGQATADDIIGEVTSVGYNQGVGVVFGGEITDQSIAEKINNGYLDVSPAIARGLGAFNEQMQAREVTDVGNFRDVAVVGQGQPGATVEVGSNPAIEALNRTLEFQTDTLEPEGENEPMDVETAKETIAEEYGIDPSEIDEKLTSEPTPDDENTVVLVE